MAYEHGIFWMIVKMWFDGIWEVTPAVILCIAVLLLAVRLFGKKYGYAWMQGCLNILIVISLFPAVYHTRTVWQIQIDVPAVTQQISAPEREAREYLSVPVETQQVQSQEKNTGGKQMDQNTAVTNDRTASTNPMRNFFSKIELYQVWFWGMVLFLVYHFAQYIKLQLYLHRGREKVNDAALLDCYIEMFKQYQGRRGFLHDRPALYYHSGLPSSICVGIFRKTVYIDSQTRSLEEMKWILSHELVHCLRGDLMTKLGMVFLQAAHWFNPFIHFYIRQMDKIIELGCDEDVIGEFSAAEKKSYCMAILNSIREGNKKRSRMSTAFVENKQTLQKRLEHIIDAKPPRRSHVFLVFVVGMAILSTNFVGCTKVEETMTEQEERIAQLYDMRASFIGDASAVGKILGLLPLPEYLAFHDEGMELFTDETAPKGVNRHLTFTGTVSSEIDDAMLERNAYLFMALVNNADFVEYTIHGEENAVLSTLHYDRKMAEEYYGKTDLRSFTADAKTFRKFVEELNLLFDCPFEEAVYTGNETEEAWITQEKEVTQLVLALSEQPMGDDFSSWAEELIDREEFDALLKLGDATLMYALEHFSNGAGEATEDYVMMLAANEIAFGKEDSDFRTLAQTTPAEWYGLYQALDSVYLAPFYQGMEEKYRNMPQISNLTLSKEAEFSKVTSKDEDVQAVYGALSSLLKKDMADGHKVCIFAPYIIEMVKTDDTMQVCCVVCTDDYTLMRVKGKGYCLKHTGGSRIPARLDFKMQDGEWSFIEAHWAKDGSEYESSIQEMAFDAATAEKMISYDSDEMTRLLYENLISYLEIAGVTQEGPYIYDSSYIEEDTKAEISKFLRFPS